MNHQGITFPQRKIKKNYRSITGHFPSIKNNRSLAYESSLEASLFLTLEFDKEVRSYMEQPQIQIQHNGKLKTYSADCHVKYHESSAKKDSIIEVKYTSELEKDKDEFDQKFKSIQNATKEMNMKFILFTEQIFTDIYIKNLDFLYRYKTQKISNRYDSQILSAIKSPISAFDLANSLSKDKKDYFQIANSIWALVANNDLCADLHYEEISMNTFVRKIDECH
ncbi:TnsA endonuclease N-terminal domain-containing protein [Sulfurovum sp.]|uniref:TnsA endonuclease N-terminal domain-containing protein n=1 Tax=Sulfurovum sp. TaxID=1969726 RepID=UPI002867E6D0|nr:TnsA endonuclease N-terminal domain-containing protein [Sulfurovum sp.]